MTAKKKKRRVLTFEELHAAGGFMDHADSPLSFALVAGAHIENALGALLLTALIDGDTSDNLLNNPKDILSAYAARADLCYCLGLISKPVYANSRLIGTIRNRFAHSHVAIDFNDEEVTKLCNQLVIPTVSDQHGNTLDVSDFKEDEKNLATFTLVATLTHMAIEHAATDLKPRIPRESKFKCLTGHAVDDPSTPAPIIFLNADELSENE